MAKFSGVYPEPPRDAPGWFKTFYENYALVIKFLNFAGKKGLNFSDNVTSYEASTVVTHNISVVVRHNLDVTPVSVQIQGGRFSYFSVSDRDKTKVTVNVRLQSSPVTDTTGYSRIDFVNVLDPSIFRQEDEILVNNQIRKITNIIGTRLILDTPISLQLPAMVTLYKENLTFVLF
jgi:hypothetical protein